MQAQNPNDALIGNLERASELARTAPEPIRFATIFDNEINFTIEEDDFRRRFAGCLVTRRNGTIPKLEFREAGVSWRCHSWGNPEWQATQEEIKLPEITEPAPAVRKENDYLRNVIAEAVKRLEDEG